MATLKKDPKDLLKTGRKTLYREEYIDDVDIYIESCEDVEDRFITYDGEKGTGYQRTIEVNLPTLEGFTRFLRNKYPGTRTTTSHMWNWEEENPLFLEATTRIRNIQAEKLMNGALSGKYEKSMSQLILRSQSRHYQPIDKAEHSGPNGEAIKTESNLSENQLSQILDILNLSKD